MSALDTAYSAHQSAEFQRSHENSKNDLLKLVGKGWVLDSLRQIWADMFEDDASNFLDDDVFFEVGGNSITVQKLIAAARSNGFLLTAKQIFLHPSLLEMAEVASISFAEPTVPENNQLQTEADLTSHFSPHVVESIYPCTPMQEALAADTGEGNAYVRQFVFEVGRDVSLKKLRKAWEETVLANPILRTRIRYLGRDIGYRQAVLHDHVSKWSIVHGSLKQYLKKDSKDNMLLGDALSRYAVVIENFGSSKQYFIWTIHHAICDATSITELLDEVSTRFRGEAVLQREPFESFIRSPSTSGDSEEEEETFWKTTLSHISPLPFPQPSQNPDIAVDPSSTVTGRVEFKKPLLTGYTKSLLLQAAWAILLHQYTGAEDVGFASINNGRQIAVPGVSRMTGPTINLVPIALRIEPKESVVDFLSRLRRQGAETSTFEHSGLPKIRKYLAESSSTAADVSNLLVIHPAHFSDAVAPALKTIGLKSLDDLGKKEQHPFPLVISLTLGSGDDVGVKIQFDERLIATEQVNFLIHHLQAVIIDLSHATKDTPLSSISPTSKADLDKIYGWNHHTPPLVQTTVLDLFKERVRKHPHSVAVSSLERDLTYAEVDEYSTALALRVMDRGLKPESYVGICFEKSIWTIVAIMAVFKAGAIYVPIDPGHPSGRIREVVQTVGIEFAITSPASRAAVEGLCQQIVTVDDTLTRYAGIAPANAQPSAIAYLLFTSGSTGKPKGILISHSAISTSILNHGPAFGASRHWRTLQFASHTFDLSIGELFTTLAFGGCVCIPSEHDRLNDLPKAIRSLHANTLICVPTVANLLSPADVPSLRTVIIGGEPVTKETITRWASHVDLTCSYGPSECSVWSSANFRVTGDANPASIGTNIGGTQWIVDPDDHTKLAAIGSVGEIVISGAILGQGYFGRKDLTDATWVPAPAWLTDRDPQSPFKTIYRTGDLARYNHDGTLYIVGRRDTQVKLRGFRIELGEIENQIMVHGTATAALAALPTAGPCAKQITAVISFSPTRLKNVRNSNIELSTSIRSPSVREAVENIRHHLSLVLADYMVPTVWVVLDQMPLLISGKIDRKAIKTWVEAMDQKTFSLLYDDEDETSGDSKIEPGSLADTLRQIMSECLNLPIENIGLGTSFFALGVDSVAAIQIVSKAREVEIPMSVRDMMSAKSLGKLTTLVQKSQQQQKLSSIPDFKPINQSQKMVDLELYRDILDARLKEQPQAKVVDAFPFSPFQREIQRARLRNPFVFLISWEMEIFPKSTKPVTLEKLVKAWENVVQTLPVLRSIYLRDEKKILPPVQVVLENAKPTIYTVVAPAEEPEPTFESLSVPIVDDCFLPHRAQFTKHGERVYIHLELDHLTIDGWSLRLIKEAFLVALEAGDEYVVKDPPSYKTYIQHLTEDRIREDNQHWIEALQHQPVSLLDVKPLSYDPSPPLSKKKNIIYLPEIEVKALTDFSVQNNVTPATIFDAAWAQTLSAFTGSSSASFEYVIAGRLEDVPDVFSITGLFINCLCYHMDDVSTVNSPATIASLAQRMQEQRVQDMGHPVVNVREVVDEIQGKKLFNTGVNFQRRPTGVQSANYLIDEELRKSSDPWHFDVLVRVMHITDDSTFRPSLEFDSRLFDPVKMQEVAEHWFNRVHKIL